MSILDSDLEIAADQDSSVATATLATVQEHRPSHQDGELKKGEIVDQGERATERGADAEVRFVNQDEMDTVHPAVVEGMKKKGWVAVDVNESPALAIAAKRVTDIVDSLIDPGEFSGRVHVIFSDSGVPNAATARGLEDETAIIVNLGLLHFSQSDAEVAAIVAHEIEHHFSDIQKRVDDLMNQGDLDSHREAMLLQRTLEMEVDLRGRERLGRHGYPTEAMESVTHRFRERFTDKVGATHVTNTSRAHALAGASVVDSRVRGVAYDVHEDKTGSKLVEDLRRDYFDRPEFQESQRAKIEELLSNLENPAGEYYEKISDGSYGGVGNTQYGFFMQEVQYVMGKVKGLGFTFLTDLETIELELRVHHWMEECFDEAYENYIQENDPTPAQWENIKTLNSRHRRLVSIPDLGAHNLTKHFENLSIQRTALREQRKRTPSIGPDKIRHEETIAAIEADLRKIEAADRLFERIFSPDAIQTAKYYHKAPRDRHDEMYQEVVDGYVLVEMYKEKDSARREELARNSLKEPSDPEASIEELRRRMFGIESRFNPLNLDSLERTSNIGPENLDEAFGNLKGYIDVIEKFVESSGVKNPRAEVQYWSISPALDTFGGKLKPITQALLDSEAHRDDTIVQLRRIVGLLLDTATSTGDLRELFYSVRSDVRPDPEWDAPWEYSAVNMQGNSFIWEPRLAQEVLDSDLEQRLSAQLRGHIEQGLAEGDHQKLDSISRLLLEIKRAVRGSETDVTGLSSEPWNELEDMLLEGVKAQFSEAGLGDVSSTLIHSYAYAKYPALYAMSGGESFKFSGKILEDLQELAQICGPDFHDTIPFRDLGKLMERAKVPDDWENLLADIWPLVKLDLQPFELEDDVRRVRDFFETEVPILRWLYLQHPEMSQEILPALSSNNYSSRAGFGGEKASGYFNLLGAVLLDEFNRIAGASPNRDSVHEAMRQLHQVSRPWRARNLPSEQKSNLRNPLHNLQSHVLRGSDGRPDLERLAGYIGALRDAYANGLSGIMRTDKYSKFDNQKELESRANLKGLVDSICEIYQSSDYDPIVIGEVVTAFVELDGPQDDLDEVILGVLESIPPGSAEARRFLDPKWVERSYFDSTKRAVAKWQLRVKYGLEELNSKLRSGEEQLSGEGMRNIVTSVRRYADRQFVEPSAAKNEILHYIEEQLITNEEETSFIEEKSLNESNWYYSKRLLLVDAPQILNSRIQNNADRWELLQYMIGDTDHLPEFISNSRNERDRLMKLLPLARTQLQRSGAIERAYLLQPLVDAHDGLLSRADTRELLVKRVLGPHSDNELASVVVNSYLRNAPAADSQYLMAYILGGLSEKPSGAMPALGEIFQAAGPFGVKVAQALRASGVLPKEYREELDEFFDNALPPTRPQVFKELKEMFGDALEGVERVREVVGSGSVNYVVLVEIRDPNTGDLLPVVLRVGRKPTQKQVELEDRIWQDVLTELASSDDPALQKFAMMGEEIRREVMDTLGPGGDELDQSIERATGRRAGRAYQRELPTLEGHGAWRVDVAEIDERVQAMIAPEHQKRVSAIKYVANVKLSSIDDPELAEYIAGSTVDSELRAIDSGVFDTEGHPGNWLIDPEKRRLVRIDTAKLKHFDVEEIKQVKGALSSLLLPYMNRRERMHFAEGVQSLLEWPDPKSRPSQKELSTAIRTIYEDPNLPDMREPLERMFFIRRKLEDQFLEGQVLQFGRPMLATLASLSRTRIQGETLGEKAYNDRLLKWLDAPEWRIGSRVIFGRVAAFGRRLSNAILGDT